MAARRVRARGVAGGEATSPATSRSAGSPTVAANSAPNPSPPTPPRSPRRAQEDRGWRRTALRSGRTRGRALQLPCRSARTAAATGARRRPLRSA
eukprot:14109094-Alexandrium_andersonii.AAC.1